MPATIPLSNAEGAQDFLDDHVQNSLTIKERWHAIEKLDARLERIENKVHAMEVSKDGDTY